MTELLELVLSYTYNSKPCINRWNYVSDSIPAAVSLSFALVAGAGGLTETGDTAFTTGSMFNAIRLAVSAGVKFINVQAKNIYSVTDFFDTPVVASVVGAVGTSQAMGGFNAFGFLSSRTRSDIRRGTKRFAGVYEGATGDFGVIESGAAALLDDIADLMTGDITYDDSGTPVVFSPCIVSKEKYTTPSGKDAYRYYATKAAQLAEIATSIDWSAYGNTRSQTSRQV